MFCCWKKKSALPGMSITMLDSFESDFGNFPELEEAVNGAGQHLKQENSVLREGDLQVIFGNRMRPCRFLVTHLYLKYAATGVDDEVVVKWSRVIGCHCLRGKRTGDHRAYFCIYAYAPLPRRGPAARRLSTTARDEQSVGNNGRPAKGLVLKRCVITFAVDSYKAFADNMTLAKDYQAVILSCIHRSSSSPFGNKKSYLVFINPKSGPGKAFRHFRDIVNPIFGEADIPYELVLTERINHAHDMVQTIDLSRYRGIVVVSGDGLIHEVINGLVDRADWRHALATCPIGVVAAGSGNALAASLCYAAGLSMTENLIAHTALMLVSPRLQPMDLVMTETASGRRHASFLSLTWGLIANIDIQSEKLRLLGGARFTVAALGLILNLRTYRATLSFLPVEPYVTSGRHRLHTMPSDLGSDPSIGSEGDVLRELQRRVSAPSAVFPRSISVQARIECNGKVNQGLVDPEEDENDIHRERLDSGQTNNSSGSTLELEDMDMMRGLESCNEECSPKGATNGDSSAEEAYQWRYLTPLDSPLPEGWVTLRGDFVTACAIYQTHLSTDAHVMPTADFDDGNIHLMIIRAGVSRSSMINLMSSLETGEHISRPDIEMIRVKAFRLEPHAPTGIISVDGERIEYGPVQAEVIPSIANVLAGDTTRLN